MRYKNIFLIILVSFLINTSYGQKLENKQFTLLSYNLNISDDITDELSELESYVDGIKTYNDPGNNKLEAIFVHIIYFTLKEKMEEQLGVEILPINTFLRKVKYDDYGYPKTNIRTALKKGYSKYYFKVDAKVESITESKKKENADQFEGIDHPVIIPQITLNITVYNKEGVVPIFKWEGSSESKYPLAIDEYLLKGFDNKEMEVLPAEDQQKDNIYLVLDRAIHAVIHRYFEK